MVGRRESVRRSCSSTRPGTAMSATNSSPNGEDSKKPLAAKTTSPPRVSFSSDLSQLQDDSKDMKSEKRKSDASLLEPASTKDEPIQTTDPNLAVHDRAAAIMGGGVVTGPPIIGSPATTTTTTRNENPSSRHSTPAASPPTSSRNRNRGLSLRSSLFTQSIERQVRRPELGIERHSFPPPLIRTDATPSPSSSITGKRTGGGERS